ncbi:Zinc finger CCCH domain-containing protein 3 [Folsomia candida]|uniref:Zinc finger CCCH domain-containing protein 3 n=1 Tax=Folsomia candida TaxID=158441 RepID=A0A226EXL4_FOLCA|nr:Zinc finger CCCH domain-containing protein 3 [Folsomia candida]
MSNIKNGLSSPTSSKCPASALSLRPITSKGYYYPPSFAQGSTIKHFRRPQSQLPSLSSITSIRPSLKMQSRQNSIFPKIYTPLSTTTSSKKWVRTAAPLPIRAGTPIIDSKVCSSTNVDPVIRIPDMSHFGMEGSTSGPLKPIVRLNSNQAHRMEVKFKKATNSPWFRSKSSAVARFHKNGSMTRKRPSKQNFSVRKYSLRRIRKSSISSNSPRSRRLSAAIPLLIGGGEGSYFKSKEFIKDKKKCSSTPSRNTSFSIQSGSPRKLSQSVRRATRVIQRSKKLLNKSKRKKNTFCIFFNKFGTCRRGTECSFIHDLRQVLICSRFLGTGSCTKVGCSLSHNVMVGKIPTCQFFNDGVCVKENCSFRHIQSSGKRVSPIKKKRISPTIPMKNMSTVPAELSNLRCKPYHKREEKKAIIEDAIDPAISSRYFDNSPASQPIISIIPRRPRKELNDKDALYFLASSSDSDAENMDDDKMQCDTAKGIMSNGSDSEFRKCKLSAYNVNTGVAGCTTSSGDNRRQKLLERITKFKEKPTTSHSADTGNIPSAKPNIMMPTFFKFS